MIIIKPKHSNKRSYFYFDWILLIYKCNVRLIDVTTFTIFLIYNFIQKTRK